MYYLCIFKVRHSRSERPLQPPLTSPLLQVRKANSQGRCLQALVADSIARRAAEAAARAKQPEGQGIERVYENIRERAEERPMGIERI